MVKENNLFVKFIALFLTVNMVLGVIFTEASLYVGTNVLVNAFMTYDDFHCENVGNRQMKIVEYIGSNENVFIPKNIDGFDVQSVSICNNNIIKSVVFEENTMLQSVYFTECENLESVVLGYGLDRISTRAFYGCKNLKEIEIPTSVKYIDSSAFNKCSNLKHIQLPMKLTKLDSYAFADSGLEEITIDTESIGGRAFRNCVSLAEVNMSRNVKEIGDYAFENCTSLKNITIPPRVQGVCSDTFYGCTNLTDIYVASGNNYLKSADGVLLSKDGTSLYLCPSGKSGNYTIPDTVKTIEGEAFAYSKLTNINMPDSLRYIADYAFIECPNLTSVVLPDSLEAIETEIFYNCTGLKSVRFPKYLNYIPYGYFGDCKGITEVVVPGNIETIGYKAFRNCQNLKTVILPDGLKKIGNYAFENTGLERIFIPPSVTFSSSDECFSKDTVILAYENSNASNYAKSKHYNYEIVEGQRTVLIVQDNKRNVIPDYSVEWYDANTDELIATGKEMFTSISGEYYAKISFGGYAELLYKTPEKIKIRYGDVNYFTAEPLKMVNIKGNIKCQNGKMPDDLKIEVTENGFGYSNNQALKPDEEGNFSFSVFDVTTVMKISADGYYTLTKYPILGNCPENELDMGEIELKPILNKKITVSLYTSAPVAEGETRYEKAYNSFDDITFSLYNETQGKEINNFTVDYPYVVLEETINVYDKVKLNVSSSFTENYSVSVGFDKNGQASAKISLKENGKIRLTNISHQRKSFVFVFDNDGKCVQRDIANDSDFTTTFLDDGNYTVVLIDKNILYKDFSSLDKFNEFGLVSGRDYVMSKVSVQKGVISVSDNITVPEFAVERFDYTIAENTNTSINKTDLVAGEYVTVRVAYEIKDKYDSSNQRVILDIPDDVLIEDRSMTIDGKLISYFRDQDGNYVIRTGKKSGIIRFFAVSSKSGNYKINSALSFDSNDGTLHQSLGTVVFYYSQMLINVPNATASKYIAVSGQTMPDSEISVYDGKKLIGKTKTNKAGSWSCNAELHNCYPYSYHDVYATAKCNNVTIESRNHEVFYDPYSWEVSKVTMYTSGGSCVFDFQGSPPVNNYYYYAGSSFTFTIEFENKVSKDLDVWLNVYGNTDVVQLKAVYDEKKDMWIASNKFESDFLPVSVEVEVGDDKITGDNYDLPLSENDFIEMVENADIFSDIDVSDIRCELLNAEHSVFRMEDDIVLFDSSYFYIDPQQIDSFGLNLENESIVKQELQDGKPVYIYCGYKGGFMVSMTMADYKLAEKLTDAFPREVLAQIPDKNYYVVQSIVMVSGIPEEKIDETIKAMSLINELSDTENPVPNEKTTSTSSNSKNNSSFENNVHDLTQATPKILDTTNTVADIVQNPAQGLLNAAIDKVNNDMVSKLKKQMNAEMESMYRYFDFNSPYFPEASDVYSNYWNVQVHGESMNTLGVFLASSLTAVAAATACMVTGGLALPFEAALLAGMSGVVGATVSATNIFAPHLENSLLAKYVNRMRELYELEKQRKKENNDPENNPNKRNNKRKYPHDPLNPLYDPSGYIYEAVPSNRVEGATVEVYYLSDEKTDVLWDAQNYGQQNPQKTDSQGRYSWDVPNGSWLVKVEKDGYYDTDSRHDTAADSEGYLSVPPPQTDVNIAIVSQSAPKLQNVAIYSNEIDFSFSQYMTISSVNNTTVTVKQNGTVVKGTISPVNAEYDYEGINQYALEFRFVPENYLNGTITFIVDKAVNYANTLMANRSVVSDTVYVKAESIQTDKTVNISYSSANIIEIQIIPKEAGANRIVTVSSSSPSIANAVNEYIITDSDGKARISINGNLPGESELTLALDGTDIKQTVKVIVDDVQNSINECSRVESDIESSSAVEKGTLLTLLTKTENAEIYYTVDGSLPNDESNTARKLYTSPIFIDRDITIIAYAVKNGLLDSKISAFSYEIIKSPSLDGTISITGHYAVGDVLKAKVRLTTGNTSQLKYQWYADDIAITNTDTDSYTIRNDDIEKEIKCVVSPKTDDFSGKLSGVVFIESGHNYELTNKKDATCIEKGYTLHTCSVCGYSYKDSYTDVTKHFYTDTVVEPTATEQGYTLHTCSVCGHSYKDKYTEPEVKNLTNNSILSAETIRLGENIIVNASASGGYGEYLYQVVYKQQTQSKWTTVQSYKSNASVSFKPANATKYDVCVKVKDSSGTEVKKFFTVDVDIQLPLENNSSISSDSINLGENIIVNASASGGYGEYLYQVVYKQQTQSKWTTVQSYKSNTSVSFKPANATKYDVCVKVKDSSGTEVKKFFTVDVDIQLPLENNSSISSDSINLGENITVNASASGGSGGYAFAVLYKQKNQSSWTVKQNYSINSIISIQPKNSTEYDICVKVKDSSGTIEKKFFTVGVYFLTLKNTSEISSENIALGDTITVKASAAGGSGYYNFAVFYKQAQQSSWTTKQNFSSNDTVSIKPQNATEYDICVKVKDSDGTIEKKYFTVTVQSLILQNISTISSSNITLGDTLIVNASAQGGSGYYNFAVFYKQAQQSSWTTKQNFSSNDTVSIKPKNATEYDICVKVQDSNGAIEKRYFIVNVQ